MLIDFDLRWTNNTLVEKTREHCFNDWLDWKEAPFHSWTRTMASALMGRTVRLWYNQLLDKPPRIGAPTQWHQDGALMGHGDGNRLISCWMPLDSVDEQSGCMHFSDGGHRSGERRPRRVRERGGDDADVVPGRHDIRKERRRENRRRRSSTTPTTPSVQLERLPGPRDPPARARGGGNRRVALTTRRPHAAADNAWRPNKGGRAGARAALDEHSRGGRRRQAVRDRGLRQERGREDGALQACDRSQPNDPPAPSIRGSRLLSKND